MGSIQFIIVLFIVSMVCSKEWYVSKLGSDKNPGSKDEPFYTIQHAFSKSSNGDSILIEAGAYKEDLKLTKSLKLFGISVRGVKPHLFGHFVIGKVKEFSLSNIHIDCSKGDGIKVQEVENVSLKNMIFNETLSFAIEISNLVGKLSMNNVLFGTYSAGVKINSEIPSSTVIVQDVLMDGVKNGFSLRGAYKSISIKNLSLMNIITKGLVVEGANELEMSNVLVNVTKYCYSENECGFSIFKTKQFHLSNCSVSNCNHGFNIAQSKGILENSQAIQNGNINVVISGGLAVYFESQVTTKNVDLIKNSGKYGGGVHLLRGNLNMFGGKIHSNTALYYGPGYCYGNSFYALDVSLKGNQPSNSTCRGLIQNKS
eukprot:gene10776-3395_t